MLAAASAPIHAAAALFETKIPGDLEWLLCFLGFGILTFIAVQFNPDHFLESGAMPFLGSLMLPGISSFMVVLPTGIFFAFLGAVAHKIFTQCRTIRPAIQQDKDAEPVAGVTGGPLAQPQRWRKDAT